MRRLTPNQARALDVIRTFIGHYGYGPTMAEICVALNARGLNSAKRAVASLRGRGLVEAHGPAGPRNMWPTDTPTYPELMAQVGRLEARCETLERYARGEVVRCACNCPVPAPWGVNTLKQFGAVHCIGCMPAPPDVAQPLSLGDLAAHIRGGAR